MLKVTNNQIIITMKRLPYLLFFILAMSFLGSNCTLNKSGRNVENSSILNKPEITEFADLREVKLVMEGKSLAGMDLTDKYEVLIKTSFDSNTPWPSKDKLPKKFDPEKIFEIGMNPGLGIKALHKKGFTGKGVKVAIIDQPLLTEHIEYKKKIKKYTAIDCEGISPQMHGPAVSSILVGTNCGVAPEALLYYWAEPSWKKDYQQRTTALEQIIDYNKNKPWEERIRIVSVSIGYNNNFVNLSAWKTKIKEAEENDIIVVHCSDEGNEGFFGVGCELDKDRNKPENYHPCYFLTNHSFLKNKKLLYVPIDNRTVASYGGVNDYTFFPRGGLSCGAPYIAGVIALGLQANPYLKEEEIYKYLRETGTPFMDGFLINPQGFINSIMSRDNNET